MMPNRILTLQDAHRNPGPFTASDLPMTPDGKVYHLNVSLEQISPKIILVGDPDRVPMIAEEHLYPDYEADVFHRGLRTITGVVKSTGQRVSIVTSGMGTPSLEIALNELTALNEIDPVTRMRKEEVDRLILIRIGTSGALQKDTVLGTSVISSHAIGLDNTGLFYSVSPQDLMCKSLEQKVATMLNSVMDPNSRFYGMINPYAAQADAELLQQMILAAQTHGVPYEIGVTVSSSGFNANQGRDVGRIPLSVPDIDLHLSKLEFDAKGLRVVNMEMEASHLLHFAGGHGYAAGVVCVAIANRRSDAFAENYREAVHNATNIALMSLGAFD